MRLPLIVDFIKTNRKAVFAGSAAATGMLCYWLSTPEVSVEEAMTMVSGNKPSRVLFVKNMSPFAWNSQKLVITNKNAKVKLSGEKVNEFLKQVSEKEQSVKIPEIRTANWNPLTTIFEVSLVCGIGLFFLLMSRGKGKSGEMGLGMGNPMSIEVKMFKQEKNVTTRFKDVAGMSEAKLELTEFVEFLREPKKFKDIGARVPRGALMAGPPGTGKTLLAKAVAGESRVSFFSVSGSEFVEMFVGVGATRIRSLFTAAKAAAPAIIFIDEIDAIGKRRSSRFGSSEQDSTLNQLLVEMDGFSTDLNVLVFAATNRKELLDPALLRPGRFDRIVEVSPPDAAGREEIFAVHLAPLTLDSEIPLEELKRRLSALTPGFSGADIASVCNEAAILAARRSASSVGRRDFEAAIDRVAGGVEKAKLPDEAERRRVAVHESGHATVAWFLQGAQPLLRLSIVPRSKGALGFAQYLPNENSIDTQRELEDQLAFALGGRAAEELVIGSISVGAADDLERVAKLAWNMVAKLGMSPLGPLSFDESEFGTKKFSDKTTRAIDAEVSKLVANATEIARNIILQNKENLEKLSELLLKKELLGPGDIEEILGPRPFPPKESFRRYLDNLKH